MFCFRFLLDHDIEQFAGPSKIPQILRPIELSLLDMEINDFYDVGIILNRCVHLCTLLSNQRDQMQNSYLLRYSLIEEMFARIIPFPLPRNLDVRIDKQQCFWNSPKNMIRFETQQEILRLLRLVSREFIAVCFSVKLSRSSDCSRIITMATVAALADCVIRLQPFDAPNALSQHYAGVADGPQDTNVIQPFAFDFGYFLQESGFLLFHDPDLVLRRTQVLDYLVSVVENVTPNHMIFKFEQSLKFGSGDRILLENLSLQLGFPIMGLNGEDLLPSYLSGENSALIDIFPQLAYFRDIVFLFKSLLSPSAESLPPLKRWTAQNAVLKWTTVVSKSTTEESDGVGESQLDLFFLCFL